MATLDFNEAQYSKSFKEQTIALFKLSVTRSGLSGYNEVSVSGQRQKICSERTKAQKINLKDVWSNLRNLCINFRQIRIQISHMESRSVKVTNFYKRIEYIYFFCNQKISPVFYEVGISFSFLAFEGISHFLREKRLIITNSPTISHPIR